MRGRWNIILGGLALAAASGCGTGQSLAGGANTAPAAGSTGTMGGSGGGGQPASISFTTQIQPIFTNNCALSGCHDAGTATQGQVLEAGKAYANIVNVTSTEAAPEKRVLPGDSGHSYLYEKITKAAPASGSQMPLGSNPLPSDQMALIKAWIDEGAPP